MVDTCAVMDNISRRHHTLQLHMHVSSILTCFVENPSEVVPSFLFGSGVAWLLTAMTLFSGPRTDVHFSGDETGLQWEDYLFELQNAVE